MIYRFCRLLLLGLYAIIFRLEVKGLHHIPETGPVILASNHLSNFDPPTVGLKVRRKVHYMAKAELFNIPLFGALIRNFGAFPVKRGGVSKDSIRNAINLLKDGGVMGIFPEGTRKSTSDAGKKGAAMIAMRSGATIIPVKITGTYKLFHKITVTYGEPVDLTAFIDNHSPDLLEQVTAKIMSEIRSI